MESLFMYLFTTLKEQRRGKPICAFFFVNLLWRLFFIIVLECLVLLYALEMTS